MRMTNLSVNGRVVIMIYVISLILAIVGATLLDDHLRDSPTEKESTNG